jgi:hypothetical protein
MHQYFSLFVISTQVCQNERFVGKKDFLHMSVARAKNFKTLRLHSCEIEIFLFIV